MTLEDFLIWEAERSDRYEFLNGEIVAMVGGTFAHNAVAANVTAHFIANLPRHCQAVSQGMKLRVDAADAVLYPDVMVSCTPPEDGTAITIDNAEIIVEVLSRSTASYDRTDKWDAYRQLPMLQAYVLLDPHRRTAEVYTRDGHTASMMKTASRCSRVETARPLSCR